jgi:hypothetical protein
VGKENFYYGFLPFTGCVSVDLAQSGLQGEPDLETQLDFSKFVHGSDWAKVYDLVYDHNVY